MRWLILLLAVIMLCGCIRIPGDANGDRCVNYLDLALLATAYNTNIGSPRYNWRVDFNHDGYVNQADLDILSTHYREGCE